MALSRVDGLLSNALPHVIPGVEAGMTLFLNCSKYEEEI